MFIFRYSTNAIISRPPAEVSFKRIWRRETNIIIRLVWSLTGSAVITYDVTYIGIGWEYQSSVILVNIQHLYKLCLTGLIKKSIIQLKPTRQYSVPIVTSCVITAGPVNRLALSLIGSIKILTYRIRWSCVYLDCSTAHALVLSIRVMCDWKWTRSIAVQGISAIFVFQLCN